MPAWQPVEGEGLLDRLLGPVGEPGIFGAPSGEPLGEIGAGLGEVAPVVEPAQFLQAVVVGLPWQVIERVPQEVHVAALVCGAGQHLADRRAQAGMIVSSTNSVPCRPRSRRRSRKSFPDVPLSRLAISTASICRLPSQSMPIARSTAVLPTTPPSHPSSLTG